MTDHEVEPDSTERQSVDSIVDTAVDSATLASKALCVNDNAPPLPCHHIKPTEERGESH